MRALLALLAFPVLACSSFTEVVDSGSITDGSTVDSRDNDGPATDHGPKGDGPPAPDFGGKGPAGACCAKNGDCVSGLCSQLGSGSTYCNKVCTVSPDDCPVGYYCQPATQRCVPGSSDYECGPQVVAAGPQPFGGCCGKDEDCSDGKCFSVGEGQFYCSQSCTMQPDNCPVGYVCATALYCATPTDSTCTYH